MSSSQQNQNPPKGSPLSRIKPKVVTMAFEGLDVLTPVFSLPHSLLSLLWFKNILLFLKLSKYAPTTGLFHTLFSLMMLCIP
jgi:hypothetical protein